MQELLNKAKDLCATAQIKITKAETQRAENDRVTCELNEREKACVAEEARLKEAGILEKSVAWMNEQIEILNGQRNEFTNDKIIWERERNSKQKSLDDSIALTKELEKQYSGKLKDLQDGRDALDKDRKEYQSKVIESVNKQLKLKGITL